MTNVVVIITKQAAGDPDISVHEWRTGRSHHLRHSQALSLPDRSIRPELAGPRMLIMQKVRGTGVNLGELCYVSYSVAAHSEVENKRKDAYIFDTPIDGKCVPFVEAREIDRYWISYGGRWLRYDPKVLRRPGLPELFAAPKIMVRDVVGDRGLIGALDESGLYADYSAICFTLKNNLRHVSSRNLRWPESELRASAPYSLPYLLGLLNSVLLNFIFRSSIGGGLHVYPENIRQLPIRTIDFSDPEDEARHDKMVELVQTMLDLHKQLAAAKTSHEKTTLQRQITATDQQIDQLVYELYGLTHEGIRIVEEGTS